MSIDQQVLTEQEIAQMREQVKQKLPEINSLSNPDLYALIGIAASQGRFKGFTVRGTLNPKEVVQELIKTCQSKVCPYKDTIGKLIDTANVTALAALLAPPPAEVNAGVIALVVILLRMGLEVLCHDYNKSDVVNA